MSWVKRLRLLVGEKFSRLRFFLDANPHIKGFFFILALLITLPIVVGAALTIQNLRQHASEGGSVQILNSSNAVITTTTTPSIYLKITLPPDWIVNPTTSSRHSGDSDSIGRLQNQILKQVEDTQRGIQDDKGIIKKAYAQSNGSTCLSVSIKGGTTVTVGQSYEAEVRIQNNGDDWVWDGSNPYRLGSIDPKDNTIWSIGRVDLPRAVIHKDEVADFTFNIWSPQTPGLYHFNWQMVQEGIGWFGSGCYLDVTVIAPEQPTNEPIPTLTSRPTEIPTQPGIPTATPTFTQQPLTIPSATLPPQLPTATTQPGAPTPVVHILTSIIIENKDTDGSTGGMTKPPITTDLQKTIDNPIPWRLNDLTAAQRQADQPVTRAIQVTLFDGTSYVPIPASITLKRGTRFTPLSNTGSSIQQATQDLLNFNSGFSGLSFGDQTQKLQQMTSIAKDREAALLKELETDPKAFLADATLVNQSSNFPTEVQPFLEKQTQAEGNLLISHSDDFIHKKSFYSFTLHTQNDLFALYFADNQPDPVLGQSVKVKGTSLGGNIVLQSGNTTEQQFVPMGSNPNVVIKSGIIKIKVILVTPQNHIDANYTTREQVQAIMFGDTSSLKDFYQKVSFGNITIQGDVASQSYTIDQNGNNCLDFKQDSSWISKIESSIGSDNLKDYDTIVYIYNPKYSCKDDNSAGYIHYKETPGILTDIRSLYQGIDLTKARILIYNSLNRATILHEMGHDLGIVPHGNGLTCDNKSLNDYSKCVDNEYWDVFDTMGGAYNDFGSEFNAPHRIEFEWLKPDRYLTVSQSGQYTYTIAPIENTSQSNIPQAILIPKPNQFHT